MTNRTEARGSSLVEPRDGGAPPGRGTSVPLAGWLALAILGFAGFAALAWMVMARASIPFDGSMLDLARQWDGFAGLWNLLSVAAYIPLAALAVGFILWLFVNHRRREAVLVVILLVAVTAGSEAVKQIVARPRPPATNTVVPGVVYSFPSGHVLEVTTILGVIALTTWRGSLGLAMRIGVILAAAALVALVAVARMSLDAHYPSDVLAGFLAGMAFVATYALLTGSRSADTSAAGPQASVSP